MINIFAVIPQYSLQNRNGRGKNANPRGQNLQPRQTETTAHADMDLRAPRAHTDCIGVFIRTQSHSVFNVKDY